MSGLHNHYHLLSRSCSHSDLLPLPLAPPFSQNHYHYRLPSHYCCESQCHLASIEYLSVSYLSLHFFQIFHTENILCSLFKFLIVSSFLMRYFSQNSNLQNLCFNFKYFFISHTRTGLSSHRIADP